MVSVERIKHQIEDIIHEVTNWETKETLKETQENRKPRVHPLAECFTRARSTFVAQPQCGWRSAMNESVMPVHGVIMYTTSCGIVREVAARCRLVEQILHTNKVKHSIRDLFVHQPYKEELKRVIPEDSKVSF